VAKKLIEITAGSNEKLTREHFRFIDDRVWESRLGHALTHWDGIFLAQPKP
jgi:hypothetical protein